MRYLLCSVLLLCQFGLLVGQAAQAADSKIAARHEAPAAVCTAAAPLDALMASSFPAMPPADSDFSLSGIPDDNDYPGYRYESNNEFACFPAQAAEPRRQQARREQWLASTRLLPSYPPSRDFIFFPLGWQWIDFSP